MSNFKRRARKGWPEYLTTGAVAKHCGVSKVTVLRWIEEGYLPTFRLPKGHNRIHREDLHEFLKKHGNHRPMQMAEASKAVSE